ncbi:rhomboid-like protease, family S54 [Nitritalea halalkaliphila LW7]|uniref:Rhomboid-like protease, family S54 n=1 Tax=Nitritalea halalkaliphila LW7 TaxID=1189621 RepID=I5C6X9_9BACT|nr:hypothetical protein [Nitritalea halalkaliphila]EIM77581.1 rhomboid-like protease, family S54 [Nitritalea halalkaliphila LW7]
MEKHYWSRLTRAMVVPVRLSFLFFLIFLVQVSFNVDLGFLGIYPQKLIHLPGIFLAPFIHGNIYHLLANLAPFLILTTTLYFFYDRVADKVFWSVYLITNLIVWVIGRRIFILGLRGSCTAWPAF